MLTGLSTDPERRTHRRKGQRTIRKKKSRKRREKERKSKREGKVWGEWRLAAQGLWKAEMSPGKGDNVGVRTRERKANAFHQ